MQRAGLPANRAVRRHMHMGKGSDPFRKKVCELRLLGANRRSDVKFVMVRI